MTEVLATNILSPLGMTTQANYNKLSSYCSGIKFHEGKWDLSEPFCASLLTEAQNNIIAFENLTHFESMVYFSVKEALKQTDINPSNSKIVFIISTTKGSVDVLEQEQNDVLQSSPGYSANKIAQLLHITTIPIVACNACISGLSAIILASRLLNAGIYDYAIVCGADSLCKFTISGFQSLKALSIKTCRPFDIERNGLNLGEAAATIILHHTEKECRDKWYIGNGSIRNDAYHISAPAKKADGAYLALRAMMQTIDSEEIAFINAHGTATMFNDQMESIAIERAGLSSTPINAYKASFGHTLGAAGIIESIISMAAIDHETVLGTKGFEEYGVSGKIKININNEHTDKKAFVKMISGFGGCNASLVFCKDTPKIQAEIPPINTSHKVLISPSGVYLDGNQISVDCNGVSQITALYKKYVGDYPKFYKMDMLSRLGFVASEMLLMAENDTQRLAREDRAIMFFNSASSIDSDRKYMRSISDKDNFYPSPSVFIYTLPNIVTGEIAIRNHYHGETSFYILPQRNDEQISNIVATAFLDSTTSSMIAGWLDYVNEDNYIADIKIIEITKTE